MRVLLLAGCGVVAAALVGFAPHDASASPLTAAEILGQFNLVDYGDLTSSTEVEGRAFVGGDLKGSSSTYDTRPLPASSYDALTVGGSIKTSGSVNVNNGGSVTVGGSVTSMNLNSGGSATIGGSITGNVNVNGGSAKIGGGVSGNLNMNGGTAQIQGAITGHVNGSHAAGGPVTVTPPDFKPALTALSTDLKGLAANSSVSIGSNTGTFNAAPDAKGVAVFSIGSSFFSQTNQIDIKLNGATTLIINVAGTSLNIQENFLGGQATKLASNIIWNFYEATSLNFNTEFGGTVLANDADVTNHNSIDGTLVAKSFNQQGEMHQYQFTGTLPSPPATAVPEPATLALFGTGILGLAALRRRRGAAAAA